MQPRHTGQGAPFSASGAVMRAGAGRPHAPRCVMSTALALLAAAAHQAGHGTCSLGQPCMCVDPKPETAAVHAHFYKLACSLRPLLQCVLGPVAAKLSTALRTEGSPAEAVQQVFAGTASPADVAAALSASLTALYGFMSLHLHRVPGYSRLPSLAHAMDAGWAQLLSACSTMLQGLGTWVLAGADGVSGTDLSSGQGSSSHSSNCGGQDSSSWGPLHDRWRAALQEYAVLNCAARVGD